MTEVLIEIMTEIVTDNRPCGPHPSAVRVSEMAEIQRISLAGLEDPILISANR
jgi:hypothetical protein